MILVGALLVSSLALVAVEAVGYARGGYNSAFWGLPLDSKLDHVSRNRAMWWWISIWELVGIFALSGGVFGLVSLLAEGGEATLSYVALGGFVLALSVWVLGLVVQTSSISVAASQRADSGDTPAWIHPFWQSGYLAEGVWIIGTNLSYVVIGIAILESGLVADWAGWLAIIGGALIPVVVVFTRNGFPQLGMLIPAALGVALLIESI